MLQRIFDMVVGTYGSRLIRRARWSWLGYAMLAYLGLRLMRRVGVFAPQADRLIHAIDRLSEPVIRRRSFAG